MPGDWLNVLSQERLLSRQSLIFRLRIIQFQVHFFPLIGDFLICQNICRTIILRKMVFLFSKKLKLSECFNRYFSWVEADGLLSPNSVEKYKEISKRLVVLLENVDARKIDGHTITNLKQQLNNNQLSASRKNQHLVVLKNLLKYLAEEEWKFTITN